MAPYQPELRRADTAPYKPCPVQGWKMASNGCIWLVDAAPLENDFEKAYRFFSVFKKKT